MEAASVPTEGNEPQETQEAPQSGIPDEVTQRLNELSGRFDQFEPVLGQLGEVLNQPEQEQQQEEPDYDQFVDESGYLDVDGLRNQLRQEMEQEVQQKYLSPLEQRLQGMESFLQRESFEGLKEQYPELQNPEVDREVGQQVQQMAERYGIPVDVDLIETVYLARSARQQAQQGVPAGGQEVALEGGSAAPGQPEVDPTKERFMGWAKQGATGGVFGRSMEDLL